MLIIFLSLIVFGVLLLIERKVQGWSVRFLFNAILIVLVAILAANVGIVLAQSLNRNLLAVAMPSIIAQLQSDDAAQKDDAIAQLRILGGMEPPQEAARSIADEAKAERVGKQE